MNASDRKILLLAAAYLSDYASELRESHVSLRTGHWPAGEEKTRLQYESQKSVAAQLRIIAGRRHRS